jgi:predicted kinase
MDLWHRGLRGHANRVLNGYLSRTGDLDGLALMPLFLSCRAAIRSKTSLAASLVAPEAGERGRLQAAARQYLALARDFLHPPSPCLVAIGGFSGSGKSTLAQALAPHLGPPPGALILRSDVIRKIASGVDPLTRLDSEAYAPEVSRQVYDTMIGQARAALQAGHAAVADAVHARPDERAAIEAVARETGVPFTGIWLEGPMEDLATRLRTRVDDASDATPDVLALQVRAGAGNPGWRRLDGMRSVEEILRDFFRAAE